VLDGDFIADMAGPADALEQNDFHFPVPMLSRELSRLGTPAHPAPQPGKRLGQSPSPLPDPLPRGRGKIVARAFALLPSPLVGEAGAKRRMSGPYEPQLTA